ncbi:MAG: leucine-rich repeat protein, partial [Muribaculaceae bacterium]|nr:leucine-rich repeat protein [Muribaculaceae bacterium]
SVVRIGESAFRECDKFYGFLTIGNSVTNIGSYAFYGCIGLGGSLTIPNSTVSIGSSAFRGCKEFYSLTIGNSLKRISSYAFYDCSGFKGSLTIPSSVTSIGEYAFYGCSGFDETLTIPASVTSIGNYAFYYCSRFKGSLIIPASVTSIGNYAFYDCSGFDALHLLPMEGRIGEKAFYKSALKNIYCSAYRPLSTSSSFSSDNYKYTKLWVPEGFVSVYQKSPYEWSEFYTISAMTEASSVSLDKTDISVTVGKSVKITATVEPKDTFDKTIVWTSSDNNIATVSDDGRVTAISVGVAIITATCGDVSASCTVTVTPIVATSIRLSEDDMELGIGWTCRLEAIVEPNNATNKNVTWRSDNVDVATVSEDGFVRAIAVGVANITATCGDVSATCKVTVKPIIIPASKVVLDKEEMSMVVGESDKLIASVYPDNAVDKSITWRSDNEDVATVSEDGIVKAISVGVANITATCGEVSAMCKVTVSPVTASSLVIDKEYITLQIGEYDKLTATVYPEDSVDKSISWCSSDNNIVRVSDEGIVTALSSGNAYITASCGNVFSTCIVSVSTLEFIFTDKDIRYTFNPIAKTANVIGLINNSREVFNLTIPEKISYYGEEFIVESINERAFYESSVKGGLTLPNTLKEIGDYAFYGCNGFTGYLIIPSSVTRIGDSAFYGCSGFTGSLNIPDNVTNIGNGAFCGCLGFSGPLVLPNSIIEIGWAAFADCKGFSESLILPNSVISIGDGAFRNCSGFRGSIKIPDSVTSIGDYAFYECNGFTGSLMIPDGVTSIGNYAFYGCRGLTGSLTIPDAVTSIGERAFFGLSGFTGSLTIGNSVKSIGDEAFYGCSGFTGSLSIPNSVTSIGNEAFMFCEGFTGSLTIGNSVKSIGDEAFSLCNGFTGSLTIPDSVTSIGKDAFSGCVGFTGSLTIGHSVRSIGDEAFSGCWGLTEVTLSNSITDIGNYAFNYCGELTSVYYPASEPISADESVFNAYKDQIYENAILYVPKEAVEKCRQIDPWRNFRKIQAYAFATGIVEIEDDINSDEPYEVYNLNGIKISSSMDNLAPGLYIVTQGSVVKKINVK